MSIEQLLDFWSHDPSVAGNVEAWRTIPAVEARYRPLPPGLNPVLEKALQEEGISALYSHQSDAWDLAHNGNNVVIVTGTASGKTLCYNMAAMDSMFGDPLARALYLFPTRALAQDQLAGFNHIYNRIRAQYSSPISPAVYDGDTISTSRPAIRKNSRLVISNPDMLHTGILPHHTQWADFLSHLKWVVLDEIHTYRGVFGSHVANVIRRLKRIAAHYGASPSYILTSATIANPKELAEKLIEESVELISEDGAAHGPRTFLIYNPPMVNQELGIRRSAIHESVRIADDLLTHHVQTIIFGRSRRTVELILTYLRQNSSAQSRQPPQTKKDPARVIRGYRSGYLPEQRRQIEKELRSGEVRVVIATNALELGIDIGAMGAAILVGYPGTIASSVQQLGRAGRGSNPSIGILIATADPLDQYLTRHAEYILERSPEQALINPDNPLILLAHLRCAAFELPFQSGDDFGRLKSEQVEEFLDFLVEAGDIYQSKANYYWMADQYPQQGISLRSATSDKILLQSTDQGKPRLIGEVDQISAHWMVHPGAVYIHEGQVYSVESLDFDQGYANLHPDGVDYYTEPRMDTTVALIEVTETSPVNGAQKAHGDIRLTTQLTGFRKLKWFTHELLGFGEISLPPTELLTTAYWLSLDDETVQDIRDLGLWRNDPNQYGPNWRFQRDLARNRDQYRCQVCGTAESGRAHDVHHKIPFRKFQDEGGMIDFAAANRLENLVTLCPSCHHRAEAGVRVRSGLAGVSNVLGHLSPFFLMCDPRDLGVHSDPQSPLSDGRPTIVLYDQVPAGIGFSQRLFELHDELVSRAYDLVHSCPCNEGCPSCVGPGGENGTGGKQECLAILAGLGGGL